MNNQWNHPYQAIPDPRMPKMLQTWHQDRGCPLPRPRFYSLNALTSKNLTIDLTDVSTIKSWNKNVTSIFPMGNKNSFSDSIRHRSLGRSCRIKFCYSVALMLATCLTLMGLAALRSRFMQRTLDVSDEVRIKAPYSDHRLVHSPSEASQQPFTPNHSPPIPQKALVGLPVYYDQAQTRHQLPYHQHLQHAQLQHQPNRFIYHYNPIHGHVYTYSPVKYNNLQQPRLQPLKRLQLQPQAQRDGFSWVDQSDIAYHAGVPVHKPWMFEHADVRKEYTQYQKVLQKDQENEQPSNQAAPESNASRKEERARVRNEARNSQGKNSSRNIGDIWEEELQQIKAEVEDNEMPNLKLVVEPAVSPYREYANTSDGKIVLKSYEDDEDITIEVVLEE